MFVNAPPNAMGTFHTHPDWTRRGPDQPDANDLEPDIAGADQSEYLPPSSKGNTPTNNPNQGGDIENASPGMVADRFYLYVFQGDGCTWVYPHPCHCPDNPHQVLDQGYNVIGKDAAKALTDKLTDLGTQLLQKKNR